MVIFEKEVKEIHHMCSKGTIRYFFSICQLLEPSKERKRRVDFRKERQWNTRKTSRGFSQSLAKNNDIESVES